MQTFETKTPRQQSNGVLLSLGQSTFDVTCNCCTVLRM